MPKAIDWIVARQAKTLLRSKAARKLLRIPGNVFFFPFRIVPPISRRLRGAKGDGVLGLVYGHDVPHFSQKLSDCLMHNWLLLERLDYF